MRYSISGTLSLVPGTLYSLGTGGDELVGGVVLVGGDEECAAEAGAGLAGGAAECVFG